MFSAHAHKLPDHRDRQTYMHTLQFSDWRVATFMTMYAVEMLSARRVARCSVEFKFLQGILCYALQ